MMSPDEALAILSEHVEEIEDICWFIIAIPDDSDIVDALKVAIECLKEKCHE